MELFKKKKIIFVLFSVFEQTHKLIKNKTACVLCQILPGTSLLSLGLIKTSKKINHILLSQIGVQGVYIVNCLYLVYCYMFKNYYYYFAILLK